MGIRDISLKTKLLVTNALMIAIPICVLVAVGAALLGGLRQAGTLQQQVLALLWPEKGATLSVQFALNRRKRSSSWIISKTTSVSSRAQASVSSRCRRMRAI